MEYLHHIPSISSLNASRPMERCPSERPRCHGWCLQYPASAPGGPRRPWMFWMIGLWPVDLQFDGILEQVMSGPPGPPNILQNPCFFHFFLVRWCLAKQFLRIVLRAICIYLCGGYSKALHSTRSAKEGRRRAGASAPAAAACPLKICLGRP